MSWKYAVVLTVLLMSALGLAGCTGPSPAPVATPAPVPVATTVPATPVPAGTTLPVVPIPLVTTLQGSSGTPHYSQTHTFKGTGDSTETFTTASDRTWVFRMSSSTKEIFLVTIKDKNGDSIDVLADASDVYAGTESVSLKAGTYYLDIAADAPWTITMSTE
jgi:hypothetical protein